MSRFALRTVSLLLMLAAFPLISVGTTSHRSVVWWLGLAAFAVGAIIPPAMRYIPARQQQEPAHRATDLGDSGRVC